MSETQTEPPIVQTFKDAYDDVTAVHDSRNADKIDGWCYDANGAVVLCGPNVSHIDVTDFGTYSDSEYVGTETITWPDSDTDDARCYGFTAGENSHWVNVEFARSVANDVFDVDYSTLRSWARTTSDEDSQIDGVAPVLFPDPNSDWVVAVFPVVPPN